MAACIVVDLTPSEAPGRSDPVPTIDLPLTNPVEYTRPRRPETSTNPCQSVEVALQARPKVNEDKARDRRIGGFGETTQSFGHKSRPQPG